MKIEQLMHLRYEDNAKGAYAEHGNFIVSWANHKNLAISIRKNESNSIQNGRVLTILWAHQLQFLDEWSQIQIALNRDGNVCFLCRMQEDLRSPYDQIARNIKMIEHAIAIADL